ncbi:hypothetical protein IIA16_02325 [bacterium]|nr:hypothetical protein [bacterium]
MSGLLAWRHQWSRPLTPSRPLGSATLYVDPTDGNLTTQIDLFPIPTRVGMRVSLVHNADSTRTGQTSQGWVLSLNERLFDNDPTDIVYMDKTGAEWTFTGSGPGYTRPAGLLATLRELTGGGWVLFMHQDFSVKTFNANGYLTETRDRNGNTLSIARNGSDEITSVTTDDSGEATTLLDTFVYVSGRLTKIGKSDCGGWEWAIAYDGSDRLNKITDPEADTLDLTYDSASSRLASVSNWGGDTTAVVYTSAKVTLITDPLTKTDTVAYPTGAQTTISDRRGKVTTYNHTSGKVDDKTPPIANMKLAWTYSTDFQVLSETNEIPATKAWTYDTLGNLATYTNELNKVWTYTTDQVEATISATETSTTDPDGNETTVRYDGRGNAISMLSPMGFLTKHTYSGNGDMIQTTPPDGPATGASYDQLTGMPTASFILADPKGMGGATGPVGDSLPPADTSLCQQAASTVAYDTLFPWLMARTQDADGVVRTMLHNKVGMLVETASYADGVKMATTMTHDANGNTLTATDAEGGVITNAFNSNNLPTTVTDAEGDATVYTYDDAGNMIRRADPGANNWDQTFDDADRLLTQTDPLTNVTTYTYNAASSVTNTNDKRGNDWATEYDDAEQVTKRKTPTTGASTADTTYTYTNTGLLSTTTDALSNVTTNVHDNDSRLVEVRMPLGSVSRTHYDPAGRVVGMIDPTGAATTYGYDYLGRQATVTDPRGGVVRRTYTKAGRVASVTTAGGHTTTNDYDGTGRLVRVTNPDNASTIYEYNANGQRTAVSTPDDGARTETVYNKVGQPTLVRVKSSRDGRAYWLETATTYNSRGLVDEVTNPAGRINKNTYDANGQVTKVTKDVGGIAATVDYTLDANGNTTVIENSIDASTKTEHSMTYNKANWKTQDKHKVSATPTYETTDYTLDKLGRTTTVTHPDATTDVFLFDALGRRTKWTDRLGRATEYEFDLNGRQTLMTTPDGDETLTSYDAAGNTVERIFRGDPTDTTQDVVESFTYTSENRLLKQTDPDGRETTMAHNSLGLLTTVTDAMGNTRENVYSDGGQMTAQLAPGNAAIYYEYTLDGRIARVTGFSGFTKEYEWCCCGMESYTDEQGTTLLEHNALSQLTSIAYASGLTVTLLPNHLNWNTKTTLPKTSGTEDTSYAYDLRGRVLSITVPDTSATNITIARDSMGRPTTIVYSGSHTVVYAWDAMGRATTITSTGKDAANTYVLTYAYVANADRVSSVTTTAAGATVSTQTYTYNARNQITKELVQDGTPTTTWERDYSWTAFGPLHQDRRPPERVGLHLPARPAGRFTLIQTKDNSGGDTIIWPSDYGGGGSWLPDPGCDQGFEICDS